MWQLEPLLFAVQRLIYLNSLQIVATFCIAYWALSLLLSVDAVFVCAGGTHGTLMPEGDPASASSVGLPGLQQSSSEGAGPSREYQLHRQGNAEMKARK